MPILEEIYAISQKTCGGFQVILTGVQKKEIIIGGAVFKVLFHIPNEGKGIRLKDNESMQELQNRTKQHSPNITKWVNEKLIPKKLVEKSWRGYLTRTYTANNSDCELPWAKAHSVQGSN